MFEDLRDKYLQSGVRFPYRKYIFLLFVLPIIIFFVGFFLIIILLRFYQLELYIIVFPVIASMATYILLLIYPYDRARVRRRNIDLNLPYALSYMASISETGVSPVAMFESVAKFGEYEQVSRECATIVRRIKYLGEDMLTVLEDLSNKTPSEEFKQILKGLISVLHAGGAIGDYFRQKYNELMFKNIQKEAEYEKSLEVFENIFTILLVVAPLLFFTFVVIGEIIAPGQGGSTFLLRLFTYVLLPVGNVGFILLLKATRS